LTPARATKKLTKFGLGKSGVKEKKDSKSPKELSGDKEAEGKLMVDEDDLKEDLDNATIWKTMHMAGGPIAWVIIVSSFFISSIYSKWAQYQTKSIYLHAPVIADLNQTSNATTDESNDFSAQTNFMRFFWQA